MDILEECRRLFLANIPTSFKMIAFVAIVVLAYTVYFILASDRPLKGFPVVALNEKGLSGKWSWYAACNETIAKGLKEHNGPFQVITGTGPKIVLPNRFANELRTRKELNFPKAFEKDFFTDYPGFDAHRQGLKDDSFMQELIRVKITQSLNLITPELVDETTTAIHDIFGEDSQWHTTPLKDGVCELVARLSSRVFLGKDLCRQRRWLDIAKSHTVDAFIGSRLLGMVPPIMRPISYWFIPHCTRLRGQLRDARRLIMPEVQRRKERARKALDAGEKLPKTADTIGWMVEVARGRDIDYVAAQLSLTMVAIHTTTEATTRALIDVCEHPEVVQPLREEIVAVISENGWTKAALQKLHLMDSFLKESSRHCPVIEHSMNRYVEHEFELSDGTLIPAGSRLLVAGGFQDPAIYDKPERFDAFRFCSRGPGQVNTWSYVSTSPGHMGFGHGQHACPGRFLAANEIKVTLCHLLLKYDFSLVGCEAPQILKFEGIVSISDKTKVFMKRRVEEITLELDEILD